ncbi:SDR family oxidoreductase [Hansschlegelia quercus]|uniref:SDR family NAD(P)-dependent oxidoreductase n=1 Tax=Hansschlegelia quercus TaxID=2528245 RepID=A0A4Q9GQL6_9HYPH|nr:SDR family oxidoreductase [Hansschlegelia quercus]TBN55104.1 SDR family NAD(P)-dependent oxidoreductase [Hansschlegelia quercus]
MDLKGNTILITGGGSGIGRALAEAFLAAGSEVIISGRRQSALDEVTAANPGMKSVVFDIADANGVPGFAERLVADYPSLNAVLNNAGIMVDEDVKAGDYLQTAEDTIATNLLGPIRLTAALLPHLLKQPRSAVLTVSSGLAFVPMVATPTYSATKAAIHSYSVALRRQLQGTPVEVIEIAPPYVRTTLQGERQAADPNAMPLEDFIAETMSLLGEPGATEIIVKRCEPLRFAERRGEMDKVFERVNAAH